MADVVTYAKSGESIKSGGIVTAVDKLGNHQYLGDVGIGLESASDTYSRLETQYTDRFDDGGAILLE